MPVIAPPDRRIGVRLFLCATITVLLGFPSPHGQAPATRLQLQGLVTARESLQALPAVPVRGARVTVVQGEVVVGTATTDLRGLFTLELEGVTGELIVQTACTGDAMGQVISPATSDTIIARGLGYFAPATTLKAEPPTDRSGSRIDLWTEIECSKYTLTASTDPVVRRFFGRGVEEPWRKVTAEREHVVVPVFYATDRVRLSAAGEFGADRREDGTLTLGRITVRIPPSHRIAEVERPRWWHLEFRESADEHLVITSRSIDDYATFYRELSANVRRSSDREALVFVHGFNVSFDEAVYRTAELVHDLSFDGPAVTYSWPSAGNPLAYAHDLTSSERSIPALTNFLRDVSARTGARRIHVVAHSRGTYTVGRAVAALPSTDAGVFKNVILLAPDIDAAVFREQIAPAIRRDQRRVTLYASSRDRALILSKVYNGGDRAGDAFAPVVVTGIDTVDATNVETEWLGHDLVIPSVLWDVFDLVKNGAAPEKRFGLKRVKTLAGSEFWTFKLVHAVSTTAGA